MKQFKTVFSFELKSFLKNKVFIGVTLFLVAVIAVVMFIPRFTDGKSESPSAVHKPMMSVFITDGSDGGTLTEVQKNEALLLFTAGFGDYSVTPSSAESETKTLVESGDAECGFVLHGFSSFEYYVKDLSLYDQNAERAQSIMRDFRYVYALLNAGVSPEEAANIAGAEVKGETFALGRDQSQNFFYTYIMIFALYMVILLYGQMVATSVASEKSSRAMELLVTSVDPVSMMFGKVLSACLAGLSQLVLIFGTAAVCYNLNSEYWKDNFIIGSIFNIPGSLLVYMFVFFILGFLIYAFMYGATGSTVSKLEDINTAVMPVTMMFIIAFFVVMYSLSSSSADNLILTVCSFIPFTSPMAMFTRIAMSEVPFVQIVLSILILAASVVGVGFVSARIYRVGVLLYGTRVKLPSLLKNIFKG